MFGHAKFLRRRLTWEDTAYRIPACPSGTCSLQHAEPLLPNLTPYFATIYRMALHFPSDQDGSNDGKQLRRNLISKHDSGEAALWRSSLPLCPYTIVPGWS